MPTAEEVRAAGRAAGLDAVGVAPAQRFESTRADLEERRDAGLHAGMAFTYRNPARSTDPSATVPGAAALVVGALGYRQDLPAHPRSSAVGRVARYSWDDHYAILREALGTVAALLRAAGWRAVVVADDNALVDREAAVRAGLGWYGKNANVLLPGQGSWFVLGSVVTDAPLAPDRDRVPDGCGSCTRCIEGCPTGAIVAPGVVDARRCLAWLVQAPGAFPAEHRVALGDRIYGCDDCQEVCPPNRVAERRGAGTSSPSPDPEAWVDLLAILAADDETLLARHGRWYIPRREPRHLRRNALVALGNVGDPRVPAIVAAVEGASHHPDPLVRGHAAWAARRLGRPDLIAHLADDPDPEVRAETSAPVAVREDLA